jgi:hypothetical protein
MPTKIPASSHIQSSTFDEKRKRTGEKEIRRDSYSAYMCKKEKEENEKNISVTL